MIYMDQFFRTLLTLPNIMEQTELTFWLTSDSRIKYYKHCTKSQKGLVTGFCLMRSMLFYMIQFKHSWSLKQTKTLFKVSHFIYIDLEQAIFRKTGWTNVISFYTPNMMSVLEEAGSHIVCHINNLKTTFQKYQWKHIKLMLLP